MIMEKNTFKRRSKENIIFGIRSVIEWVKSGKDLNKILIQRGMNKELFLELKDVLAGKSYQLQFVPIEKLNSFTDQNHQGVIALTSPIKYYKVEDIVEDLIADNKKPFILALDRITDVRNFGAIARAAECQGVDAILIPSKGSAKVNADSIKTSSGALGRIKVCITDSLKDSLFYIQQCGVRIIACTEKSKSPLNEVDLKGSIAFILGSEKDGITSDLLNISDFNCRIPMSGKISSLNVSVAAGILLYERYRQEIY